MMRRGKVYVKSRFAGIIGESDAGYYFSYDQAYLGLPDAEPVSVTLPLRNEPYESKTMIPFFAVRNWTPARIIMLHAVKHFSIPHQCRKWTLLSKNSKNTPHIMYSTAFP